MEDRIRKITILHSNDIHGKFTGWKDENGMMHGSLAQLSGYISRAKEENPNTIYCNAGDMFQGSLIDSDYQGLSTMQILNMMDIDVMSLGNHELDYGISHMLFVSRYANFPIINTNFLVKGNRNHLFRPHHVIKFGDVSILFIGLITENILDQTKAEGLIGTFVSVEDAEQEIRRALDRAVDQKGIHPDITILLTHIGFEEDKKLAAMLDPAWGVDIIIGGHSHTFIKEPAVVNGIPIVQAGTGTDQIGRFDIVVDTENNCIESYKWQAIPINAKNCPRDERIEELIGSIKAKTDLKYSKVVANFDYELSHPDRWMQTELGGVFADAMKDSLSVDLFFMGSGSVRKTHMGPIVTFQDFTECYPYDGKSYGLKVTGAQLKKMLLWIYRDEAWEGEHTEFYQLSKGMHVIYSKSRHEILKCELDGEDVLDDKIYTVGIQEFHYNNLPEFFNITHEEVNANGKPIILTTSDVQTLLEYFENNKHLGFGVEGRLEVLE